MCSIDPVAAFCSSDEENENSDCLQFLPTAPEIEDPEDNWPTADTNISNSVQGNGPPPAKKKKYRSYDIALENASDGGKTTHGVRRLLHYSMTST